MEKQIRELVRDIDPEVGILDAEGEFLFRLARQSTGNIVEIGSWKGRSTVWLAKALQGTDRRVFAVDPHGGTYCHDLREEPETFQEFMRNIMLTGVSRNVRALRMYSAEAPQYVTGDIGMVFIDGDHSYSGVKSDCEIWLPLLISSGLVALHDTIGYEGPRLVAHELLAGDKYKAKAMVGQIIAFTKNGDGIGFSNMVMEWYFMCYSLAFRATMRMPQGVKDWLKSR